MNAFPLITVLTAVPLIGAIAVLGVGAKNQNLTRGVALIFSFIALAMTLILWHRFNPASGELQFEELHNWIPAIAVQYHLGIDGLGLLMLLLSAILVPMSIIASWQIQENTSLYFSLILFLQAGLFGTFSALNFFHWFLFWELSLIPALAAKIGLHRLAPQQIALIIFCGAFLGFAVKVPLIPFHTWVPETYAEAPTGTTMLLTGAMSKMGVYGFLRILLPIFYVEMRSIRTPLLWLAVATIVLSAYAALAQSDLKRILAYSSINHLGYCMLGIFSVAGFTADNAAFATARAAALNGVILQMFNHGLTAATLFWFVALLEKRSGSLRGLNESGGLRKVAPVFCGLMGIALFSSLGLPGLNGFVGEFLIFRGAFPLATWATALSVFGLLATAIFILTILQRVFSGPLNVRWSALQDLTIGERLALLPPIALMFVLGIYPQLVLGVINSTTINIAQQLR